MCGVDFNNALESEMRTLEHTREVLLCMLAQSCCTLQVSIELGESGKNAARHCEAMVLSQRCSNGTRERKSYRRLHLLYYDDCFYVVVVLVPL